MSDHFTRQLNRKSQIVTRGNEAHRPSLHLEQARDKWRRADWLPEFAQLFKRQMILNSGTHMLRRDTLPDDVRDIARYMIEDSYLDFRIVRKREKGNARPDAGSHNADAFVPVVLQPANGRACVEHSLADRLNGPAD